MCAKDLEDVLVPFFAEGIRYSLYSFLFPETPTGSDVWLPGEVHPVSLQGVSYALAGLSSLQCDPDAHQYQDNQCAQRTF